MELLLKKREIIDLGRPPKGTAIVCLAGCCWLTQTGDTRDYVLRGGDRLLLTGGRALVTAGNSCRLEIQGSPSRQRPFFIWGQLGLSR